MWSVSISVCATFRKLALFRSPEDCLSCWCCRLTTCKHAELCVLLQIGLHTHDVSEVSSNAVFEWLAITALYFFARSWQVMWSKQRLSEFWPCVSIFWNVISNSSISEPVLGINIDLFISKNTENLPVCIKEKNKSWSFRSRNLKVYRMVTIRTACCELNEHSILQRGVFMCFFLLFTPLTLIVLMWRIGWAHNNARK